MLAVPFEAGDAFQPVRGHVGCSVFGQAIKRFSAAGKPVMITETGAPDKEVRVYEPDDDYSSSYSLSTHSAPP